MKYFALFALGLTCLQQLALAQTPSEGSAPTFENTPGLLVTRPQNGMSVYQGASVLISATLPRLQPANSVVISVAKTDGSSNTTIADLKGVSLTRIMQIWNLDLYPIGDYHIIITPDLNAPARTSAPATTTTAASAPIQSPAVGTLASVYYWRGLIHVLESQSKVSSSAVLAYRAGSVQAGTMAIFYKMSFALGALALGCVILL